MKTLFFKIYFEKIIGKPVGHVTFLACQEMEQEMSPTNMNVAPLKVAVTLVEKNRSRRPFCGKEERKPSRFHPLCSLRGLTWE